MRLTDPIPLSLDDADAVVSDVASIRHSSLTMTPLGRLRYGAVPPGEARQWLESCCRVELQRELAYPRIAHLDHDGLGQHVRVMPRMEHLVVRDLDLESLDAGQTGPALHPGRVVAFAAFKYHHPPKASRPGEGDAGSRSPEDAPPASSQAEGSIDVPDSAHRELHEHWDAAVEAALETQFGGLHCFEVRDIGTLSPSHLRRGIAGSLLRWVFPWADRYGVPVVLAATPPGYPFYLRHGFVEVDGPRRFIECDMAAWGGAGVHRHVLMVRWPQTSGGNDAPRQPGDIQTPRSLALSVSRQA